MDKIKGRWSRVIRTPLVMLLGGLLAFVVFKLLSRFGY